MTADYSDTPSGNQRDLPPNAVGVLPGTAEAASEVIAALNAWSDARYAEGEKAATARHTDAVKRLFLDGRITQGVGEIVLASILKGELEASDAD